MKSAQSAKINQVSPQGGGKWIRWLIFLYIILWIVEGAFRKWFTPQLSGLLLVVRDPVLIMILLLAVGGNRLRFGTFVSSIVILGGITLLISLLILNTSPIIALFGFRANFLHLLLIFVMADVLRPEDVWKIGKGLMLFAPVMAVLVILQFGSDPGARINTGAGGGEGGQIESSRGKIRPAGTFSYNNGLAAFTALIAAFVLRALLELKKGVSPWIFIGAGGSVMAMLALSGSRSSIGQSLTVLMFMGLVFMLRTEYFAHAQKFILLGGLIAVALSFFVVLREGLLVLSDRFGDTSGMKENIFDRLYGDFITSPLQAMGHAPLLGIGLGMGTNAAASLLTGSRTFMLAEGDLARAIFESGPILGLFYDVLRFGIAFHLIAQGFKAVRLYGQPQALLLAGACFTDITTGQFGQPTSLGGAVITAGLCLAAAKPSVQTDAGDSVQTGGTPRRIVGRSIHAQRLNPRVS